MTDFIRPMLLLKTDRLPEGAGWLYELKLDGYRAIAFKRNGDPCTAVAQRQRLQHLRSPGGREGASRRCPHETVIDGEVAGARRGRPPRRSTRSRTSGRRRPPSSTTCSTCWCSWDSGPHTRLPGLADDHRDQKDAGPSAKSAATILSGPARENLPEAAGDGAAGAARALPAYAFAMRRPPASSATRRRGHRRARHRERAACAENCPPRQVADRCRAAAAAPRTAESGRPSAPARARRPGRRLVPRHERRDAGAACGPQTRSWLPASRPRSRCPGPRGTRAA